MLIIWGMVRVVLIFVRETGEAWGVTRALGISRKAIKVWGIPGVPWGKDLVIWGVWSVVRDVLILSGVVSCMAGETGVTWGMF